MKQFFLSFLLSLLLPWISIAQQSKVDSLLLVLKKAPDDTVKVNTLNTLSREYTAISNFGSALYYAEQAKELAERIQIPGEKEKGWPKGIASSLGNMGIAGFNQGDFKKALDYHLQALKIREKIENKRGIGNSSNSIAVTYSALGNIEKALEYHMKSLKMMEEIGDKNGVANSYNNIGALYLDQGNYEQALKNFYKTLKIREELNDKFSIAGSYNNIGSVYYLQGKQSSNKTLINDKYQKTLDNYFKSLKIREEIGDKQGEGSSYTNIGLTYIDLAQITTDKEVSEKYYKYALDNNFKSLEIGTQISDKELIWSSWVNLGTICFRQNKLEQSQEYFTKALNIAREMEKKSSIQETYFALSGLFEKKQDYKKALEYRKLYSNLKDTLLNETTGKQIAEMNTKYDTEKKDKELIQKDAEITKQQAESEKQQTQRNAFIIGFGLVLLMSVFIFRSYRHKQEANRMLEIKNEAINQQNIEIEKKNTLITDSIEYAKDIQQAILPSEEELKKQLKNYFILYKPKDIVSGDFYWIHEQADHILFAVADCTGHGVPGAFMSLLGHNLLKEVVNNKKNPSQILDELNRKVLETLKQESNTISAKYGMDIALISLDKKMNTLAYAGAHNSLYIYRNKECIQLKGDTRSIGTILKEDENAFTNQTHQLEKGDMLYLFSDGYVDQKGGPEGKQFFFKSFKKLLQSNCELDLSEQKQQLDHTITSWQGNKKQTDDILVVGIRV